MYRTDKNPPLYRWEIFDKYAHLLEAGISCRSGGVSQGEYSSFNQALHCGDKISHVLKNRKILCRALNVPYERYTCAEQTHGAQILTVTETECGAGRDRYDSSIKNTDALLVGGNNIMINIHLADCVPVALFDVEKKIGALVHAGWKGTAQLIALKTVEMMINQMHCRPEDIIAGIGPSIGSCCFEINRETAEKLRADFKYSSEVIVKADKKYHADLKAANKEQLLFTGIKLKKIEISPICTCCSHEDFFSYRAHKGKTGRFAAFMVLK